MAKRAALGYKYLSLPGQFMVPDEDDLESARESRRLSAHDKEKLRKLRCYHKNKERYNATRRKKEITVSQRYGSAKRFAKFRNQGWNFTQDEWEQAWIDAGWVRVPGLEHPVTAYSLRGSHRYKNTCMQRRDLSRPWGPDNYVIMYRGEELKQGSRWSAPPPT